MTSDFQQRKDAIDISLLPSLLAGKKEKDSKIKTNTTDTENTKPDTSDSNPIKSMQSDTKILNSTSITNTNIQKSTGECLQKKNL